MLRSKQGFSWLIRKLGAEVIPHWQLTSFAAEHLYVDHLKRIFSLYNVDCVFDVGASDGHFAKILRQKIGFTGMIFSFEPQPDSFAKLESASKSDTRWRTFNSALGASNSTMPMNIMARPWFSSFLPPRDDMPDIIKDRNRVESTCEVKVQRLDNMFDELVSVANCKCPFLKMDTQGFDLEVLKGASDCIREIIGLQSEVSLIPIYDGMPDWREALNIQEELGYELTGLFPVTRDGSLRLVELDAVSIRINQV